MAQSMARNGDADVAILLKNGTVLLSASGPISRHDAADNPEVAYKSASKLARAAPKAGVDERG
jgi:hypothetical protein